jgi:hypothetical protein
MILLVLLAVSTLFSLWMCWSTINRTRELRYGREEATAIETKRRIGTALAADTREYSKTHPDILPILKTAGVMPEAAPATPKPATK